MRALNLLSSFVFVAFLLAPVVSLLSLGYDKDAENIVRLEQIELAPLIGKDRTYRDDIIRRALINSPAGISAIRWKNRLDYGLFRFVDTEQVISGRGDWLYYKPEFEKGECTNALRIEWAIDKTEAFEAVADAAGIDFLFSVSPDKSIVVEAQLGTRARIAAGCKLSNGKAWRNYAFRTDASLLDHYTEMRLSGLNTDLYFKTDTHWNELGGALALQQISKRWLKVDTGYPEPGSGELSAMNTDLRTGMLRLPVQEDYETYPDYWQGDYHTKVGDGIRDAVVIHDSFYTRIIPHVKTMFPEGQFFDLNHKQPEALRQAIANRPNYLLVNSVERRFIHRLISQDYSWNSPLGKGLIDANQAAAADCEYSLVDNHSLNMTNANISEVATSISTDRDPRIFIKLAGSPTNPCIRLAFTTSSPTVTQIFLPILGGGSYREGMSVKFYDQMESQRTIELVLPQIYAGSILRFDPDYGDSALTGLKVEIGQISG